MRKKQLIIIGAPKSGTTTLAALLNQGEKFRVGDIKEPKYYTNFQQTAWTGPGVDTFVDTLLSSDEEYEKNFDSVEDDQWCIDASTDYLWCPVSAKMIKDSSTKLETRVICILRNPVERAISEYAHTKRDFLENLDLIESFKAEEERKRENFQPLFYHKLRSSYSEQVQRYLNLFTQEQFLILEFNELKNEQLLVDKICEFLDEDKFNLKSLRKENVSNISRLSFLKKIMHEKNLIRFLFSKITPSNYKKKIYNFITDLNSTKITVSDEERFFVEKILFEEVKKCKELLPIDTDGW